MTTHEASAFAITFQPSPCLHADACDCEEAYEQAWGQLENRLRTVRRDLELLAWIDVDEHRLEVLEGEDDLSEFLSDAIGESFDAQFDGAWLTLRTQSGPSHSVATYTLLAIAPYKSSGSATSAKLQRVNALTGPPEA
jgi:hypothetical protein